MDKLRLGICAVFIGLVLSCSQSDQEKTQKAADTAQQKAEHAAKVAADELKKAGREAKAETATMERKIDQSLQGGPDGNGAENKLHAAGEKTRNATARASVKLSHAALIAKVKSTLMTDVGLSTLGSIDVDTTGHVVTLNGTVDTEDQKRQAEQAVAQIDGVSKVINNLAVK